MMYTSEKYLSLEIVERIFNEFAWPEPFFLDDELPDGIIVNFPACHFLLQEGEDAEIRLLFLPEDTGVDESLELGHAMLVKSPPELRGNEPHTPGLANRFGSLGSAQKLEDELRDTCIVLQTHFQDVLRGNFDWVNRYLEYRDRTAAQEG